MRNKFTKMLSFMLSLVMVLSMTITASAASITIHDQNEDSSSTYKAYLLFNATEGEKDGEKFYAYTINEAYRDAITEVVEAATKKTDMKDAEILDYIDSLNGNAAATRDFAGALHKAIKDKGIAADYTASGKSFTGVPQGYYLIEEEAAGGGTESLVMLDTAGSEEVNITTKEEVPSVTKQVYDGGDLAANTDAGIGDAVKFHVEGTLPSTLENFETYRYQFVDTPSAGLTFKEGSVHVTVNGNDVTGSFTVSFAEGKLTVACADILKIVPAVTPSDKVVLEYEMTVTADAVTGTAGNENKAILQYENDPYAEGTGELGSTPEAKVTVFVFELDGSKVDKDAQDITLEGAEFVLYKAALEGDLYAQVSADGTITGWTAAPGDDYDGCIVTSGSDGSFKFKGLDSGTYMLKEIKSPDGYTLPEDPFEIVITATLDEASGLTALSATMDSASMGSDLANGTVSATVGNSAGTLLPSTGGIGTTVFYVAGVILVVFAGYMLLKKKEK